MTIITILWAGASNLAKLPRGFQIPTPVGNYTPDWAIAFYEGAVKHIYFVAETKGSMNSIASKINGVIAKGIAKLVGGTLAEAKGEGIKITVGKLMIRIMTEAGGRTNYFKLSYIGKQAFDIFGQVTNDPSKLHIPITIENIVRLIDLIFKLK